MKNTISLKTLILGLSLVFMNAQTFANDQCQIYVDNANPFTVKTYDGYQHLPINGDIERASKVQGFKIIKKTDKTINLIPTKTTSVYVKLLSADYSDNDEFINVTYSIIDLNKSPELLLASESEIMNAQSNAHSGVIKSTFKASSQKVLSGLMTKISQFENTKISSVEEFSEYAIGKCSDSSDEDGFFETLFSAICVNQYLSFEVEEMMISKALEQLGKCSH